MPGGCRRGPPSLGPLDLAGDRTLELTLRAWVRELTGLELGYVEQLYTFGDRGRIRGPEIDPRPEARVLSVAYLALVRESALPRGTDATWQEIYQYLPWEDGREGHPEFLADELVPRLQAWIQGAPDARSREERRDRTAVGFGLFGSDWDGDRVLERYELLYGAGLVPEAHRDRGGAGEVLPGRAMGADHRRMLATASAASGGRSATARWCSSSFPRASPSSSSSGWWRRWPGSACTSRTSAG
jgi:hypothetical protein